MIEHFISVIKHVFEKKNVNAYYVEDSVPYIKEHTEFDEHTILQVLKWNDYYLRDYVHVLNASDKELNENYDKYYEDYFKKRNEVE